jgi:hypothetical protein
MTIIHNAITAMATGIVTLNDIMSEKFIAIIHGVSITDIMPIMPIREFTAMAPIRIASYPDIALTTGDS